MDPRQAKSPDSDNLVNTTKRRPDSHLGMSSAFLDDVDEVMAASRDLLRQQWRMQNRLRELAPSEEDDFVEEILKGLAGEDIADSSPASKKGNALIEKLQKEKDADTAMIEESADEIQRLKKELATSNASLRLEKEGRETALQDLKQRFDTQEIAMKQLREELANSQASHATEKKRADEAVQGLNQANINHQRIQDEKKSEIAALNQQLALHGNKIETLEGDHAKEEKRLKENISDLEKELNLYTEQSRRLTEEKKNATEELEDVEQAWLMLSDGAMERLLTRLDVEVEEADSVRIGTSYFSAADAFHHGSGSSTAVLDKETAYRTIAGVVLCAKASRHTVLPARYRAELWNIWMVLEQEEDAHLTNTVGKSLLCMAHVMLGAYGEGRVDSITLWIVAQITGHLYRHMITHEFGNAIQRAENTDSRGDVMASLAGWEFRHSLGPDSVTNRRVKLEELAASHETASNWTLGDASSYRQFFILIVEDEVVLVEMEGDEWWSVRILERERCFLFRVSRHWYLYLDIPDEAVVLHLPLDEWQKSRRGE